MKKAILVMTAISALLFSACSKTTKSGDGSVSTGGQYFTHEQLAEEFARRLEIDLGYNAEVVKANTFYRNYAVIKVNGQYNAYHLKDYRVGEDVAQYAGANNGNYYDLKRDLVARDQFIANTGLFSSKVFTDEDQLPTDLETQAAISVGKQIERASNILQNRYGLSANKSLKIATLSAAYMILPAESRTAKEADLFAQDVLGSSITQFKAAADSMIKQNDKAAMEALVQKAAATNGIGLEGAKAIIKNEFGVEI